MIFCWFKFHFFKCCFHLIMWNEDGIWSGIQSHWVRGLSPYCIALDRDGTGAALDLNYSTSWFLFNATVFGQKLGWKWIMIDSIGLPRFWSHESHDLGVDLSQEIQYGGAWGHNVWLLDTQHNESLKNFKVLRPAGSGFSLKSDEVFEASLWQ